jgi:hypothetical protein
VLVSSVAKFNAVGNDAAFMAMVGNGRTLGCGGGCPSRRKCDFAALNESDKRMNMDNITNSLTYKVSILQEEMAKKRQDADIKRSFSTFA